MKTVYKYPLEIKDVQIVEMPSASTILSVGIQSKEYGWTSTASYTLDEPVIWALVNMEANHSMFATVKRTIHIIGIGSPIPEVQLKFIGTIQMKNGLVWHIFEEI